MKEKYENWIDGLKFIACINVFITHYIYTFYTSIDIEPHIRPMSVKVLDRITCAQFAVFVFVLVSGYLANKKVIHTLKDLIIAIILRYISLFIPVFFISFFYLLLHKGLGMSIDIYAALFNNEWLLSQSFPLTLIDFIKTVFLFDKKYLGVLWMIPALIKGNVTIYLFNYLFDKKSNKVKNICSIILIVFLYIYSTDDIYFVTTVTGMALPIISKYLRKIPSIITFVPFAIGLIFIKEYPFWGNTLLWSLLSVVLVSIIMANDRIQLVLSVFKSQLSLPIYLLHLPVVYSFSLKFYSIFNAVFPFDILFWINLLITSIMIAMLSWIFLKTVSPVTKKGLAISQNVVERIMFCFKR